MFIPLISFDNLHEILRSLYQDMMPLCGRMTFVASAIAGLAALLYISYRVWQCLARAEAIDVFPLLRPFVMCICIVFFQDLVLGSINGILSPVVQATHTLYQAQGFDMDSYQRQHNQMEAEIQRREVQEYFNLTDEEYERQFKTLDVSPEEQQTMSQMYHERSDWSIRGIVTSILRWLLELLFEAATLIIDTIRTFYLVVLSILGPIVFAIATFDGFQASLAQWFTRYVSVYLWLPVADLFGAILSRLQVLVLQHEMQIMASDPYYYFNLNSGVYLVFMLIGIIGYFTVPSVASWIVQAGGFNSYNGLMNKSVMFVGGKIVNNTRSVFSSKNSTRSVKTK